MKRKFKRMMVGMLVLSMLAGGVLTAQADTTDAASTSDKLKIVAVPRNIMVSLPMSEIQYQKFIAYLTQEYAPELQTDWEKAFAARASIEIPVQVIALPANVRDDAQPGSVEVVPDKGDNVAEGDLIVSKTVDDVYKGVLPEGGTLNIDLRENIDKKLLPEAVSINMSLLQEKNTINETFIEQLQLQDELDQAIQNNDGKAINKVLAKMLANYNKISEDIQNSMSKEKNNDTDK